MLFLFHKTLEPLAEGNLLCLLYFLFHDVSPCVRYLQSLYRETGSGGVLSRDSLLSQLRLCLYRIAVTLLLTPRDPPFFWYIDRMSCYLSVLGLLPLC